jgi:hypothetical protein
MKIWKWLPWVLVIALAVALAYERFGPRELTRAVAQGRVQAQVQMIEAGGNGGDSGDAATDDGAAGALRVALTLARPEGVNGRVSVTWPAGSMIRSGDPGEQRLMTALPVSVQLDDASPSATVEVEVYCLDQFAKIPTAVSALSLPAYGESQVEYEETEPLRKLAQCLAGTGASARARQYAVWMVGNRDAERGRDAVRERLVQGYRADLQAEGEARLQALAEKLRRDMAHLAPDRIEAAIDRYRRQHLDADIERTAREQAQRDIDAYDGEAREVLRQCRDDLDAQPYYAGGP